MAIQSGKLRQRVTFEALTKVRDSHGAEKPQWMPVCTVWAAINPLSGKSLFAAQQNHSEITGTIDLRYRADINAELRAVHEGKIYSIHAVINPELRNKELKLMVSEGVRES